VKELSQNLHLTIHSIFPSSNIDHFVKSRNQTAKKKDPDARRANPEE
jgi:hypothetical protein